MDRPMNRMTAAELLALPPRHLDVLAAEQVLRMQTRTVGGAATWRCRVPQAQQKYWQKLPYFSTSLDDARELEDEIEKRGLQVDYIHALSKLTGVNILANVAEFWCFRRFKPVSITVAAILTLEADLSAVASAKAEVTRG